MLYVHVYVHVVRGRKAPDHINSKAPHEARVETNLRGIMLRLIEVVPTPDRKTTLLEKLDTMK